jgi:hypothetical protein
MAGRLDIRRYPGFAAMTVLCLTILYVPLVVVMVYSFNASRLATVWGGFSTKWYVALFNNDQVIRAAILAGKAKGKGSQRNTMGGFGIHAAHKRHKGGGNGGCHGALLPRTASQRKPKGVGGGRALGLRTHREIVLSFLPRQL